MGGRGAGGGRARSTSTWCAPALLLYYLCCWPSDSKSDTSSENNQSRRSTVKHEPASRRASHFFSNRFGSSAVSLHLPSTSVSKKEALSAHRSHEEIGRRQSHHELPEAAAASARYHSAPSVIREVLHRRDWESSARDLCPPTCSESDLCPPPCSGSDLCPPPCSGTDAQPRSPSPSSDGPALPPERATDDQIVSRPCKKHHTNIKSSKAKEKRDDEDKDSDATELYSFYIGDNDAGAGADPTRRDEAKAVHAAKEAKQSFNESIRSQERPRGGGTPRGGPLGFSLGDVIGRLDSLDRSGAHHRPLASRVSLHKPLHPPPSVEPAGYEGCQPERPRAPPGGQGAAPAGLGVAPAGLGAPPGGGLRARHASDGDILAPPHRPESGAFSESDLELEVSGAEPPPGAAQPPPAAPARARRETAI